ncbi:hypothetical protein RCG23_02070 [Neobacillus sp. PS3-34]|uniref:hypothetical protein n=1 Tax=Neobacillus sp. PS3-34 TaxID=3070678 RepID=UPI0027E0EEBB|nr:hypothetical protein [Neobacillus sp. PS3-34]WML48927.1 hypothetical protein RCG23_02070 [Neobacillus sp. PS3-34]
MEKWNEQGATNNNLPPQTIRTSKKMMGRSNVEHEFSEELSDGAERDLYIQKQVRDMIE